MYDFKNLSPVDGTRDNKTFSYISAIFSFSQMGFIMLSYVPFSFKFDESLSLRASLLAQMVKNPSAT